MSPLLFVAALAFFTFYLAGRLTRRARKNARHAARLDPFEHHVEEQLVLMIGDALDLDAETLSRALRGAPDTDVVSTIEKRVQRVELVFEKRPGASHQRVDLSVEVHFEDGKVDRRINEVRWAWLPTDVEGRFHSTGTARVHREWLFPWQRR
jgi:hypothetical protein